MSKYSDIDDLNAYILNSPQIAKYIIPYEFRLQNKTQYIEIPYSNFNDKKAIKQVIIGEVERLIKNNNLVYYLELDKDIRKMTYLIVISCINVLETDDAELLFKYKNAQINQ